MRFGVLGSLAVWTSDGRHVVVPGVKVRTLLAALLVHEGRPVPGDRLIDDLWGAQPPGNAPAALSAKVSQLRRTLEDAEPGSRGLVVSPPPGYRLRVGDDAVDAARFRALTARARRTEDPRARVAVLSDALALWRGPAFADFAEAPFARATSTGLEEQRLTALEDRAEAQLAVGLPAVVADELGELLVLHPLRERLRALHMLALYRSGRQAEALRGYDRVRRHLAEELGVDPGPELVGVHRAILTQETGADGPGRSAAAPRRSRTNLPAALSPLVGRDAATAELRALLGTGRLVTLTGPGGVGKTRLAAEVGRSVLESFPDGVWLVELSGFDRSQAPLAREPIADSVLATLDVRDGAASGEGPATPVDRLVRALRARRVLLVLDNCEHLVEPVAQLAVRLLGAVPGLRILATSREPVGVPGEVVWPVPPLEVPGADALDADRFDAERLTGYSAARMFVARAADAARGFALTPDNAGAVVAVCRRLDGLPLALELAATRVRALGIDGVAAGLDDRFGLLATGLRGAPARQQTLLATIDWSWQLLDPVERAVLRRLAVHVDGCTAQAAQVVCAADGAPPAQVLDVLARLVDRSLVVTTGGNGGHRYRLLESVAAYCTEHTEPDELREIRERHRSYYADLAEQAEPHLRGPGQREWLQRLDAEAANLRTALDGAVHHDGGVALRIANALTWYWFLRGRLAEADRSLRAALDGAAEPPTPAAARAKAWQTGISFLLGDTVDWPSRHAAALDGYRRLDDAAGRARAQWFLAYAEIDLGDVPATAALLDQAVAAFTEGGDDWGLAAALSSRAKLAHITSDPVALEHNSTRSAALFRRLGDRWGVLQATEWLGAHAGLGGDLQRAERLHRDGLRIAEELGLWPEVSGRLSWLGWMAMQRGDYAAAREHSSAALRLETEQGSPLGAVFAELGIAFAARREGELDIAEKHLNDLLEGTVRAGGDPGQALYRPSVLVELGYVSELRADADTATARHAEALADARRLGAAHDTARALAGLAGAAALRGRPDEAARLLGAADAVRTSIRAPLAPADQGDIDRASTAARVELGEERFAAAFRQGRSLDPADVHPILAGRAAPPVGGAL